MKEIKRDDGAWWQPADKEAEGVKFDWWVFEGRREIRQQAHDRIGTTIGPGDQERALDKAVAEIINLGKKLQHTVDFYQRLL